MSWHGRGARRALRPLLADQWSVAVSQVLSHEAAGGCIDLLICYLVHWLVVGHWHNGRLVGGGAPRTQAGDVRGASRLARSAHAAPPQQPQHPNPNPNPKAHRRLDLDRRGLLLVLLLLVAVCFVAFWLPLGFGLSFLAWGLGPGGSGSDLQLGIISCAMNPWSSPLHNTPP
jgi:hypothetical protein